MRIAVALVRGRRRLASERLRSLRPDLFDGETRRVAYIRQKWESEDSPGTPGCQSAAHCQFHQIPSLPDCFGIRCWSITSETSHSKAAQNLGQGSRRCHSTARNKEVNRSGARQWTTYDPPAFAQYYRYRPYQVAFRAVVLMSEVCRLSIGHFVEKNPQKRAQKLRRSLVRLGAFYIKAPSNMSMYIMIDRDPAGFMSFLQLGQALSTRPDILPIAYCKELAKLQDHVPPFPTSIALECLESELGAPPSKLYAYITPEPIAAASLGQVYKANLLSGEPVAVKVQRPGLTTRLALDAHLLRLLGGYLQRFTGARGDLIDMTNEMVERMFEEVDYVREGRNAERFNKLYGITQDESSRPEEWRGLQRVSVKASENSMEGVVKVPKIYWDLTSTGVLTMEWIDGIKLTDPIALKDANLDSQRLVDQGVFCSLRQLLEEGFFHADPHPGNLVATKEGVLAYFDFGMMSEIRKEYRVGLIRTIVHFVNRDSLGLAKDFVLLGFIPENVDVTPIVGALSRTFGVEGAKTRLDFQGIMSQLSDVMYQFSFRLPPEYTLVIRALGSLEGTATTLDPGFKVVASAYPFIVGRLLADPDPAMREVLRELLLRNNGSIRWQRLERLVFAIAEQSSSTGEDASGSKSWSDRDGLGKSAAAGIKGSFNTRAVAFAAMDLFEHILSGKGFRIRTLLVQDVTQTFDRLFLDSIAQLLDVETLKYVPSAPPADATTQRVYDQTPFATAEGPANWRNVSSVSYWGKMFGKRLLQNQRENVTETGYSSKQETRSADENFPRNTARTESDAGGYGSKSEANRASASADGPNVDDFANRVKVGVQAFIKAVDSAPEIWIPLMIRLLLKPEARSLAAAIMVSVAIAYCRRTSEASFLLASKVLHKQCRESQTYSEQPSSGTKM